METTPQEPREPETPAADPEDPAGGPPPAPDEVESGIGDAEHDEESAGEDSGT